MIRCDALVVGGGPAGSTCARTLRRAGWDVVLADRSAFPRDKVCAGWLTPGVFTLLELRSRRVSRRGAHAAGDHGLPDRPHRRHGSSKRNTHTSSATRFAGASSTTFSSAAPACASSKEPPSPPCDSTRDRWIANEAIEAPVVIGAGGHFCPVARHLRGSPDTSPPIVAKEAEFRLDDRGAPDAAHPPELLFCRDLEGYAWCVRKGEYLNVGIGRRDGRDFGSHVRNFIALLEANGTLKSATPLRWRGHAYFASGVGPRPLIGDGMLIVGDGAGLAYPESGEGIHPAIASGRLAAETLIACRRPMLARRSGTLRGDAWRASPSRATPRGTASHRFCGTRPRAARVSPLHEARRARSLVPASGARPSTCSRGQERARPAQPQTKQRPLPVRM